MKCWLNARRTCNEDCAAFLKLEAKGATITIDGVSLWQDDKGGMWTCCAIVGLWEIGSALRSISLRIAAKG
jgi:hypothetical protein